MCILCVVQRWSRRVATMLPWLVIPLIILWALSQLLPLGLRFEVTSPRLACVVVLLLTLFWYEVLLPRLSLWRAHRSARIREIRRIQAIELQKLRKAATRRCRNCLTAYRDQNPLAGKYMCSYCGHLSKRPVLDIPPPVPSSGALTDLVGKNGWMCSQDWVTESNGIWVGDDRCADDKSFPGVFVSAGKLLSYFCSGASWLWKKVFNVGSSGEDGRSDSDRKRLSSRKNDGNLHESRVEKAKRKAEEKRQARLEKEMLEEEERKQREEVAQLVEERRKLRDEMLKAEKGRSKGSGPVSEKRDRKETERRRQEMKKDKDSKSNSDGEEREKSTSRESVRKREFEKRAEHERRDSLKIESSKSHTLEPRHGNTVTTSKARYIDRMKGTFLSSSRGFNGTSIFGSNAQSPAASVTKASKPANGSDQKQGLGTIRSVHSTGHAIEKPTQNRDQLIMDSHPEPAKPIMKKSWHQLFTRSSVVAPDPDTDTTSCLDHNSPPEAHNSNSALQEVLPNYSITNNQNSSGCSLPSDIYPLTNGSFGSDAVCHGVAESMDPFVKEPDKISLPEEAELFEDPCYIPDSSSLLWPASELVDNFPQDLGAGFVASAEIKKPSPIESPMSRLRNSEERRFASGQAISPPKSHSEHASSSDDSSNANGPGIWQMWGTPLAKDGLDLAGGSSSWFSSPLGQNRPIEEYGFLPSSYNPMNPQITKENISLPAIYPPSNVNVDSHHNGGTFSPHGYGMKDKYLCMQNTPFQTLQFDGESQFRPRFINNGVQNGVTYTNPNRLEAVHPSKRSPANCWSKEDWVMHGPPPSDGRNLNPAVQQHVGGLFPTDPGSRSVWSFK